MVRNVIFRDEAENDLTQLALYIAGQSGPVVANRYLDRIYAACAGLAHFPERCRRRDDILPGLRTVGFERRATIVFRVLKTRVEIVSIAYGGRDFESNQRKGK